MDFRDAAHVVKNARKIAIQTVNNSAAENRSFLASTVQNTANKGVKILEKTELGANVLDAGKVGLKTAQKGVAIVEKTKIGGNVLDAGKLVGGAALGVTGTLADTLTDGAGLVGGAMLGGTKLLGEGINMLLADDTGSGFFHEEPEKLEGYDNEYDKDEMLPVRFHDPEKEPEIRASMKVEWDEFSWEQMDGDPEGFIPAVVVDKTVSQRKLDIKEEKENPKKDDSDEEESVETAKTNDIYFTAKEIQKKEKAEKKERKRLKKERKRMSLLARQEAEKKEEEAKKKEEEVFGALGKSFALLTAIEKSDENEAQNAEGANGETLPGPPIQTLEIVGRQTSENMDGIQKTMRSKQLWGKLRSNVAQRGVVKALKSSVEQKKDFFDVFDDNDEIDGIADPMGDATAMLNNEHDSEKVKVEKLRKQLDDYEANLEKERKEVEEERKRIATEKQELEKQHKYESERNAELTKQSQELKKDLDVELEKKNESKLQRELEELRAENEVLQELVEKHDTILRQLHREKAIREKREKRKQLYAGDQPRRSSNATVQTFRSSTAGTAVIDDEATVVTYVAKSRRTTNLKVMEENLEEMNDELEARQQVIEMQVMELESLQKQLREAEDKSGLKPLKDEFLELQKQREEIKQKTAEEKAELTQTLEEKKAIAATHAAEVSRLKLEQTQKELKAAQEVEPPAEKGGLFGMLWGDTPKDETSDADVALSKLGL
mmetsp:Transcript_13285/g.31869  ORF Transcript_13285/g.31869 Transcript_13285/m.31869 type:complete len:720 (+) Transcript_13285:427-2586(+)